MGLDDRDYMRERRRAESKAARLGSASWIDKKGRLEHHDLWFDAKSVGQNYREGQYRTPPRFVSHPWQKWIILLCATSFLVPIYGEVQRKGWLPDLAPAIPFPETGSVTVSRTIDPADKPGDRPRPDRHLSDATDRRATVARIDSIFRPEHVL